ncbi:uncharacterized protein F4822DRAFT_427295 [Hypoxylon trugodes]|uniref:uncharacterized protein n=1 Tax=Hypoxylon trugodes TaxID=326681 RepID=UPI00219731EC|nr:uncharacterized protein F4822DRAFT_427295 [Hypoxylon trugodes]KAI1391444.1 hypothetical protein F4822DRAFT_427295 [Hypoxylon trugodes]
MANLGCAYGRTNLPSSYAKESSSCLLISSLTSSAYSAPIDIFGGRSIIGIFRKLSSLRKKRRDESCSSQTPSSIPFDVSIPIREDVSQSDNETGAGPLGLTVVYTPKDVPKADIIFVHGLGGTSRWTWSKNKDPDLFWPLKFLPLEADICQARILTFGYNAEFRMKGSVSTSILDFAKDLLYDMKYARDYQNEGLNIGDVPLIFVVHSMGGLVVKEAYIQGQNDPEYDSIIKAVSAIVFLSTPHRGTHLAETLNRILQSTMIISSKNYISELVKNSLTLQRLNEQFRHVAPRLDIVSFYETRATSIMVKSIMVLEKESSVLGYPGEISRALDADHHGVCKFDSPKDPNYIAVKNVLVSLLEKCRSASESKTLVLRSSKKFHDLKSLLAITELPAVDYSFFRDQWVIGTCTWIIEDKKFLEWLQTPEPTSRLLWVSGGPGTGKSVLSSFIINNLVERGVYCQYFFIRFGDQKKRTLNSLLCSLAYQLAQAIPEFSQKLLDLDEATHYGAMAHTTTWDHIFKSILFRIDEQRPLYWIIDGLDEADDPRGIIKTLSEVSRSSIPIRILIVGRRIQEIESAFQTVPSSLNFGTINVEGHQEDLQHYTRHELILPGSPDFKEGIVSRIVQDAQNNFLWIRFTISKLNQCHRRADVELALQELPNGMEAFYNRMASSIARNQMESNKALALNILECVTCSFRGLTIVGLSQILDEDSSELLDLGRSVVDLCGGFLDVDNEGNVTLIHQTAREYLLSDNNRSFRVDPDVAHKHMFLCCMKHLMTIGLRSKVNRNETPEFVHYASKWWSSHLVLTAYGCEQIESVLEKFLTNHWVLTWIHIVATNDQQQLLIQVSKNLAQHFLKQQKNNAKYLVKQELLGAWSTDFAKLVGKFGAGLRRNPESIYKQIPPLCPKNSSIYRLFGEIEAKNIAILGAPFQNWGDLVARIPLNLNDQASTIVAAATLVGIATSRNVFIYSSSTFDEVKFSPIQHGEFLHRAEFNNTATLLATYGYRTTKVWETSTGTCRASVDNPSSRPRPVSMVFKNHDSLLVGHGDKCLRLLDLNKKSPTWQLVANLDEPELEGHFLNLSSYMALSQDGALAVVAYRGHPLSAWEVDGPVHLGHCWRTREQLARGEVIDAVWHPQYPEVLGLYVEGVLFKWSPYDGKVEERFIGASRLSVSKDGNFLATGDKYGIVKVFNTTNLCILHHFTSQNFVLGLTFGHDYTRVYDIRASHWNVWELDLPIKPTAQPTYSGETESDRQNISIVSTKNFCQAWAEGSIIALATSPTGRLYSYGTDMGRVCLVDLHNGRQFTIHPPRGRLQILEMSWSHDGRYISFSDASKTVFIKSVALEEGSSEPVLETVVKISMREISAGPITQLLFHPKSSRLLVSTFHNVHTISLLSLSVDRSLELVGPKCQWIAHPRNPELIIGFGTDRIQIMDWNLAIAQTYHTTSSYYMSSRPMKIVATRNENHILVQARLQDRCLQHSLHCFRVSDLLVPTGVTPDAEQKPEPRVITPIDFPDMPSKFMYLLSSQFQNRIVFLAENLCIYSYQLPTHPGALTTVPVSWSNSGVITTDSSFHSNRRKEDAVAQNFSEIFTLPGDWIEKQWADIPLLCTVWEVEKVFLCVKDGGVIAVRCPALV